MKSLKFVVPGRAIVKKNTAKVRTVWRDNVPTKRKVCSPQYQLWAGNALPYLINIGRRLKRPIKVKLNASFKFYFKNHSGEADLAALYEGIQDEMVNSGIITDDRLIYAHNGSEKIYDPKEPERIEVELMPLDEWKRLNGSNGVLSSGKTGLPNVRSGPRGNKGKSDL